MRSVIIFYARVNRMERDMKLLKPDEVIHELGDSIFTRNMVFHKSLASTNTLARELAANGAPEGTIVLTEEQTSGRGRMGRRWLSPGYVNLLVSILLRPHLRQDQIFILTMILALAAIESIKEISGLRAMIKWPNDLYVDRKKLAGILTEFSQRENKIEYVILGIGINVNWNPDEQKELINPATSILKETGIMISRNVLLSRILKTLEKHYQQVLSGRIDDYYRRWNELSVVLGKEVEIESGKERFRGKAIRITKKGALVIKDNLGNEQDIFSGDVSLKF